MLSSEEIIRRVNLDRNDPNRIVVVPRPKLEGVRKRGATSLDLRLGRWFISGKQAQRPSNSLAKFPEHNTGDASERGPNGEHLIDGAGENLLERKDSTHREHFVRFGDAFTIHPGSFVLGATLEWIRLPQNISAQILGRSSLGRHGLVIETASGIHPNFTGCLTLEMANLSQVPVQVYPGMEIAQIFFFDVLGKLGPQSLGGMSGNRKPIVSRIKEDIVLTALQKDPD